jgi:hypothetical protein
MWSATVPESTAGVSTTPSAMFSTCSRYDAAAAIGFTTLANVLTAYWCGAPLFLLFQLPCVQKTFFSYCSRFAHAPCGLYRNKSL